MAEPLVSIGLPVFNGEKDIEQALDSLTQQDYPWLEITVSDNGSTDRTREICHRYALKDSRVKYHRSEVNRGAAWNFNRVFELSSGEYFMWAAHDDQHAPTFVSACVSKMEGCPTAVLCHSHTETFIEGRAEVLSVTTLDTFDRDMTLVERYSETLYRFPACAIYGLYRSSAVRNTRLLSRSIASDLAFVQELSLQGDFVQVPQVLFSYHGRPSWNTVHQDYRFFVGGDRKPWWYFAFAVLFTNHWRRVAAAPVPDRIKLRLWAVLLAYQGRQLALKLILKTSKRVCPSSRKERVATAIYWRWMHNPNVSARDAGLFLERVIKPTVGWWK